LDTIADGVAAWRLLYLRISLGDRPGDESFTYGRALQQINITAFTALASCQWPL